MPVTFILGRAGTGKTRHCLDALLAELERPNESRRLLLLVPEQASFQMERTLAIRATRHGYWRAEVLSFTRLAQRVFEETGALPRTLRPTARALGLRGVAGRDQVTLTAFGPSARTPGFFIQLDRLIEELLLENVTPDQLAAAAGRLEDGLVRRRVAALACVYRDYLAWLGSERIDPAQRLAMLRKRLAGLTWLPEASIWVDGFAGFTGQELETLVALAKAARDVAITLLLDPASPAVCDPRRPPDVLNLFHRPETTYQRLIWRLREEAVELQPPLVLQPPVPPRFADAQFLARLEANLATPIGAASATPTQANADRSGDRSHRAGDGAAASGGQVRFVECETHRDELRAAARFIRQKVTESNGALRFRDFAVIARDLDPFAPTAADVFAEYEIPYFLDQRRPLGVHALARFVQSLLEAVAGDFSTDTATRLLRCGLLPLSRAEAETLENVVVKNEVRGFAAWKTPTWSFDPGAAPLDAARLQITAALESLVGLASADSPPPAATWARTLYETLVALRIPAGITTWIAEARQSADWETGEVHRLAWDALCELLEDVHDALGEHPLELRELAAVVGSALGELTVGLAPPTLDQVLVSSIERSRHPDIKYAWVFAFNDGVFPARPGEDPLLSATERESLAQAGLRAPGPRRDDAFVERMFGYIALTRPSHGLTISYAKVGENGEPRFPSPLLDEVRRALPSLEVEAVATDEPPVCLDEFARDYLSAQAARLRQPPIARRHDALRAALQRSTTQQQELARLLRGMRYHNAAEVVGNYRRPQDRDAEIAWDGSPSELEAYLQCPFKHFALYGLSLSALRGPAPAALELGQHAHEIIADVTRRAMDSGRPVSAIPNGQWLGFLDETVNAFAERQPPDLSNRRPQAAFLRVALQPFLKELVLAHAERWRRGDFEPVGCELRFGAGGAERARDPLELTTATGERIRLHGFIDRVDRCEHGGQSYLLVYDYKSSPGNVKRGYLTQDRLQLFTYLLAVERAFSSEGQARVAGALLAPLYPDVRVLEKQYFSNATEADARMYLYRPSGLFDAGVARLLDRDLGQRSSPVAAMQLKKDGGFYQYSDAKPRAELNARLELARQTVLLAAEGIIAGQIDVAPLLENRTLACQRCDFRPVCRFEPIFNRPRVAEQALPTLTQASASDSRGSE